MTTKFLSDAKLEGMASRLLGRYESLYGAVSRPPVPAERILEDVLDLNILWDKVSERPGQSILAELDSSLKTVVFNESRRTLITETPGLYHTILAHEVGHWEAHVDHALLAQSPLPGFELYMKCLYRGSGPGQDPRDRSAHALPPIQGACPTAASDVGRPRVGVKPQLDGQIRVGPLDTARRWPPWATRQARQEPVRWYLLCCVRPHPSSSDKQVGHRDDG